MTNPYPDYEEREARKREDSNKMRNGRGDVTTDATEVKIMDNCAQLHINKSNNLEEVD